VKMPAEVRTALRKIIRNHPDVGRYVHSKSDVNSLTRDKLIELADKLEIDFIGELQRALGKVFWSWEESIDNVDGELHPFVGELEFDIALSALGVEVTLRSKVPYEHTPEWQYYCPHDKRLKYRRASSAIGFSYFRIPSPESYRQSPKGGLEKVEPEWMDDGRVYLLPYQIQGAIDAAIERECWSIDQERRKAAGFPPGDPANNPFLSAE